MTTAAISVRDLTIVRGPVTAVDHLSLEVPSGQVIGLLGPSGSGKSSLMRAIVGVQVMESGSIDVLGQPAGSPTLRAQVGYVTQDPSVYSDLSVLANLRYFARILGVTDDSVERVLDQVDLREVADRLVGRLSGGQRSRVSLGTALLGSPQLLVLDEPTVGLDPALRRDLWTLFHQLATAGTTVFVSSHVMEEASRCDRLLLLRDGRLLAEGTQSQLLERTGCQDIERAFLAIVEGGAS